MAALLSLFLMVALSLPRCNGEMFTALIHMEGLLGLERELLHQLNTYIVTEKNRLKELEEFSEKVERALNLVDEMEHTEDHLHDPVNAFQLTNRFTNGWMILHENVYQDNAESIMANISLHRHRFPTHEDYQGAMTALRRLQDTYDLDPVSVAKGNLSKRGLTLTSSDCYALGRSAYNEQNWKHTRDWMLAALSQYNDGELVTGIDLPSIYDHISYAEYNVRTSDCIEITITLNYIAWECQKSSSVYSRITPI
jgi:prolyl 4-hydroxylase